MGRYGEIWGGGEQHHLVEDALQLLVGEVDAQLLERVARADLEAEDIEHAYRVRVRVRRYLTLEG